ncbi:MAG: tolB protein precursor, periplasmic protein involved in the tonb-independent uptake of group A colicins, partial [uncultured Gemmatimonadaceae bacterium]
EASSAVGRARGARRRRRVGRRVAGGRAGVLRPEPGAVRPAEVARARDRALPGALLPRGAARRARRRPHGRAVVRAAVARAEPPVPREEAADAVRVAHGLRAEQRDGRPRRGDGRRDRRGAAAEHAPLHRGLPQLRARAHARDGAPVPVRHLRPRQGRREHPAALAGEPAALVVRGDGGVPVARPELPDHRREDAGRRAQRHDPEREGDDRPARPPQPVRDGRGVLRVHRAAVGRRGRGADHGRPALARRGARVQARARALARGARRRLARGDADALAAAGRAARARAPHRAAAADREAQRRAGVRRADALQRRAVHRVPLERALPPGRDLDRPVPRGREHRQAPRAADEHAHRREHRGAPPPLLAEQLLPRLAPARLRLAAAGEGRAQPDGRAAPEDRAHDRPRLRAAHGPGVVARRPARRVQRESLGAHRPVRRGRRRPQPPAAHERQARRPAARVVARRPHDRVRQRPRPGHRPRRSPLRQVAALDAGRGVGARHPAAQPERAQSEPAVVARRPVARLRLRPRRHGEHLPVRPRRARALPAHEPGGRGGRLHGVQPGDQLGARRRPAGVLVPREGRVHGVERGQPALAAARALPRPHRAARDAGADDHDAGDRRRARDGRGAAPVRAGERAGLPPARSNRARFAARARARLGGGRGGARARARHRRHHRALVLPRGRRRPRLRPAPRPRERGQRRGQRGRAARQRDDRAPRHGAVQGVRLPRRAPTRLRGAAERGRRPGQLLRARRVRRDDGGAQRPARQLAPGALGPGEWAAERRAGLRRLHAARPPAPVQPLGVPDAVLLHHEPAVPAGPRHRRHAGAAGDRAPPDPAGRRHLALPAQPLHAARVRRAVQQRGPRGAHGAAARADAGAVLRPRHRLHHRRRVPQPPLLQLPAAVRRLRLRQHAQRAHGVAPHRPAHALRRRAVGRHLPHRRVYGGLPALRPDPVQLPHGRDARAGEPERRPRRAHLPEVHRQPAVHPRLRPPELRQHRVQQQHLRRQQLRVQPHGAPREPRRARERGAPLPRRAAARPRAAPDQPPAGRGARLLRRRRRLEPQPVGHAAPRARRLQRGRRTLPAHELRRRAAREPLRLRDPAVGLRDPARRAEPQGVLDVDAGAELL